MNDSDEFNWRRKTERLHNLEIERSARLEAATACKEDLRTKINRIHKTVNQILHEDTTLGDKICTLFCEQGVTNASVLTAIGLAISNLVLALTGGGVRPQHIAWGHIQTNSKYEVSL